MTIEIDYDLLAQKIVDKQTTQPDRLLTKNEVLARLGKISEATLYRGLKSGIYPKSIKLGRTPMWKKSIIDEYIANL